MSAGGPAPRRERRIREQQRRRGRTRWVVLAGIVVVLLAAGGTATAVVLTNQTSIDSSAAPEAPPTQAGPVVFPDDEPAATAGAQPCTTVTVLSSLENSEMVSRLADGYNAQPRDVDCACVTVVPTRDKSGVAAEDADVTLQRAGAQHGGRPGPDRAVGTDEVDLQWH